MNEQDGDYDDDDENHDETQVYSCDKYARHRLLGEAEFRLADVDLRSEEIVRIWLNLHEIDEVGDNAFAALNVLGTAHPAAVTRVPGHGFKSHFVSK